MKKEEAIILSRDSFSLCLIKVLLDDGRYEVLASNLPRETISEECLQKSIICVGDDIECLCGFLKGKVEM